MMWYYIRRTYQKGEDYMYEERKNRFSLRDIILQILLLVLFVFILVWLFPTKNFLKEQNVVENDKLYTDYMTSMSTAAKDYFTTNKVPTKVGESVKLTLNEMLDKKLVLPIGGKASCDLEKSYIEVTKMDEDYRLRVELSCEDYADYIVVTLGCKDFCNLTCTTTPNTTKPNTTKPSTPNPSQQSTKKYTVTFDSNGGSSVDKQTVESGKKAAKPANPTKDGYTFIEWTLNGKTYDFNNTVTSNITLVATWKKVETKPEVVKYTVTFNSNGGSAISSQTVVSGVKAVKPANPTKDGYTFVEWTLNGKTYDFNTAVTSNITLVASWKTNVVKAIEYQYSRDIPTSYTYYDWSEWSTTQRVWEKNKTFTDTTTMQYKVVNSGQTAYNGNDRCSENDIIDKQPAKLEKEIVYADFETSSSTKYSDWKVVSEEYVSSVALKSTTTEKYDFVKTQVKTLCVGCAQTMEYVYKYSTREAVSSTVKACPSGYTKTSDGKRCYKEVENYSCSSYGEGYTNTVLNNCIKRGYKCTPIFEDFTDYQYRKLESKTAYNTKTDYKWSTSKNDGNLISMGYRLTGTTR